MSQERKSKIQNLLRLCSIKIKELAPKVKESKRLEQLYNKYIIEKAVLQKELDALSVGFFHKLFKKTKATKQRLICDYFGAS